jgi:hypothetical protein
VAQGKGPEFKTQYGTKKSWFSGLGNFKDKNGVKIS